MQERHRAVAGDAATLEALVEVERGVRMSQEEVVTAVIELHVEVASELLLDAAEQLSDGPRLVDPDSDLDGVVLRQVDVSDDQWGLDLHDDVQGTAGGRLHVTDGADALALARWAREEVALAMAANYSGGLTLED